MGQYVIFFAHVCSSVVDSYDCVTFCLSVHLCKLPLVREKVIPQELRVMKFCQNIDMDGPRFILRLKVIGQCYQVKNVMFHSLFPLSDGAPLDHWRAMAPVVNPGVH